MFAALAATRFAHFAAICLLFGLAAFPFYARPKAGSQPIPASLLKALAVLALLTGALQLMATAGNMGDTWRSAFDPQVVGAAVTDTVFGRVWIGRMALALLVVGLTFRRSGGGDTALLLASGILLASIALTGHSAIPGGTVGSSTNSPMRRILWRRDGGSAACSRLCSRLVRLATTRPWFSGGSPGSAISRSRP